MTNIEKVYEFLNEAGTFYLSTTDGNQPKCRPLGFKLLRDGQLYFGVGDFKNVYKQMVANPLVEIVGLTGAKWIRIYGTVVFEEDYTIAAESMKDSPLKKFYDDNGYKMMIFHLEDATAEIIQMMTVEETINF